MSEQNPIIPEWCSRTALLYGEDAVRRLLGCHVLAVGCGGVGAVAIEMLVRAGIGAVTIADGDTVDKTNRNRQLPALMSTVGQMKTDVLARRLTDINPELKLNKISRYLTEQDMETVLDSYHFDLVLDAIDTIAPKIALLRGCIARGIPVVSSMGAGAKTDPEKIRCADISKTEVCGLARAVRLRLRKEGITKGITAIYSTEPAIQSAVVASDDCGPNKKSVTGTVSFMPALFGCHCCAAAIRILLEAISKLTRTPKVRTPDFE